MTLEDQGQEQQKQQQEEQQQKEEEELLPPENGDVYCEDDGAYIGAYERIEARSIPIELSLFHKGLWFIYKLDRKETQENEG